MNRYIYSKPNAHREIRVKSVAVETNSFESYAVFERFSISNRMVRMRLVLSKPYKTENILHKFRATEKNHSKITTTKSEQQESKTKNKIKKQSHNTIKWMVNSPEIKRNELGCYCCSNFGNWCVLLKQSEDDEWNKEKGKLEEWERLGVFVCIWKKEPYAVIYVHRPEWMHIVIIRNKYMYLKIREKLFLICWL